MQSAELILHVLHNGTCSQLEVHETWLVFTASTLPLQYPRTPTSTLVRPV